MNTIIRNTLMDLGMEKMVKDVEGGRCPLCHVTVKVNELRDKSSKTEFCNSGICQKCQDSTFK